MYRLLCSLLLLAFAVLAAYRVHSVSNDHYAIVPPATYASHQKNSSSALYTEQEISTGSDVYNHSPTIAALPNGNLISVWYAGAREGGTDMKLKLSIFSNGRWGKPKTLLSPGNIPYVTRRIGNAIVFVHPETPEKVTIVFTSTLGGWATSYLNVIVSYNNAESWGPVQRLMLGNVFNLSHLVRCAPLFLSEGRVAIPAYHEFINKFGLMLILNTNNQVLQTVKLSSGRNGIQPCVAVRDGRPVRAFLRDANSKAFNNKLLTVALNSDFSPVSKLQTMQVTNEDTSIAIADFHGATVLAFSDSLEKNNLTLGILKNHQLQKLHVISKGLSGYPYMVKQQDVYHLVYNKNKTIVHLAFNEEFIKDRKSATSF